MALVKPFDRAPGSSKLHFWRFAAGWSRAVESAYYPDDQRRECSVTFAIYMLGLAILIGGIAWGLVLAGLAVKYIIITCLIVGGIGIMMAASRTRTKDSP
jgi:hypothetical protein